MSWRTKATPVADISPAADTIATQQAPSPSDPDAMLHAVQARAKAQNVRKPVSELESLLLGLTKGATLSQGNEIGNIIGVNPDDLKAASKEYVNAGKDNPGVFTAGEMVGRLPYQVGSGITGALTAGASGAVDAIGRSTDKLNSVKDAALEGLLSAALSGPGLSKGRELASKTVSGARAKSANVLRGLANVVDTEAAPLARSAVAKAAPVVEQATGELAAWKPTLNPINEPLDYVVDAKKLSQAGVPMSGRPLSIPSAGVPKAPTYLEGDMGLGSLPYDKSTPRTLAETDALYKSLNADNPALGELIRDKISDRGIGALVKDLRGASPKSLPSMEGPTRAEVAQSAVQSLKQKLRGDVAPSATTLPALEEDILPVVEDVLSATSPGKAAAKHKAAMAKSKSYSDAYKNLKE